MASRMGRLHSLRQFERERRFKAWTIVERQIFRRFDRRANAKRVTGSVTGADLFPCARLLPVESPGLSRLRRFVNGFPTHSASIEFRVIATDFPSDGRSTFIPLFLSIWETRLRVDRLVADRAMNAGGKNRNRGCVRCVAGRRRAGPPAQSLRNRTRAGLVPEVDLIAPGKLSFPLPHLSRQSILKRNGLPPPPLRASRRFRSVSCPVSVNSIPYHFHVHCTHPVRGPAWDTIVKVWVYIKISRILIA